MECREIALIEFGGSHSECLYSQVLFLKRSGYTIHLIIRSDHYRRLVPYPEVDYWKCFDKAGNWFRQWMVIITLHKYLKRSKIRRVILNTAHGNLVRKFVRITGSSRDMTGILHNSSRLWTSRTQKIISRRIRKYFVLADYIKETLDQDKRVDPTIQTEYFFPVFFMEQGSAPISRKGEFRICIPGAVDLSRRDYNSLLTEIRSSDLPDNVRFILLGRSNLPGGRELLSRIDEDGMAGSFISFGEFVPNEKFHEILVNSDMILPLITPGSADFNQYLKYKISGAYNLAFGYQIPLLMHDSLVHLDTFRETSVFYPTGGMVSSIRDIMENRSILEGKKQVIKNYPKFRFDDQMNRYTDLIKR